MKHAIELPESSFLSAICMLLEEHAREHDADVCEYADNIYQAVNRVNDLLGKY